MLMTVPPLLLDAVQLLSHSTEDLLECGPAVVHLVSRLAAATLAAVSVPSNSDADSSATTCKAQQRRTCDDALHLSETLRDLADEKLNSYPYHAVPACWRRLYTDASLYGAIARLASSSWSEDKQAELLEAAIGRLDLAIVISGTPGPMRHELALSLIELAQERLANTNPPALQNDCEARPAKRPRTRSPIESGSVVTPDAAPYIHLPLTELAHLPAFLDPKHNPVHRSPFIVRNGASSFPAFSAQLPSRHWSNLDNLRETAGQGRIVPVEVGGDYTQAGWGQRMMEFGAFLDSLGDVDQAADRRGEAIESDRQDQAPPLYYLAQHSLFRQFPALLSDLLIPDLVYSPPSHHFSSDTNSSDVAPPTADPASASTAGPTEPIIPPGDPYISPTTEDGYILNAWLGPRGTKSAAHTDPWWNCYVQMAGSKWIWVAPPECGEYMATFGGGREDSAADGSETPQTTDQDAVEPLAPVPSSLSSRTNSKHAPATVTETAHDSSPSPEENGHASDYMTNTSSFDVTTLDPTVSSTALPRAYREHVVPRARQAVLREGDVLVMPPGWWHAMVGLETSFSVSMWF